MRLPSGADVAALAQLSPLTANAMPSPENTPAAVTGLFPPSPGARTRKVCDWVSPRARRPASSAAAPHKGNSSSATRAGSSLASAATDEITARCSAALSC